MERPSISEHFAAEALQQGIEQGARERALKNIFEVLIPILIDDFS